MNLLERPPEEAARLLALSFLAEASAAHGRLRNPDDGEALHDFRVAVRRLRSCCRGFRPYLKASVSRKQRRRLREITLATNAARDTEVQLNWVRARREQLLETERAGADRLIARLQARRSQAHALILDRVSAEFVVVEARLRRRLSEFQTRVHLHGRPQHPSFGRVAGTLAQLQAVALRDRLAAVVGVQGTDEAHRARIAAKRLRYLLEPLARRGKRAKALVDHLRGLQDLLGEVRDTQVLVREILSAREWAVNDGATGLDAELPDHGADAPRVTAPDLDALARLGQAQLTQVFCRLEAEWLGGRAEGLLRSIERFGKALATRRRRDVEIERKFLLTGLPARAREVASLTVEQGWIPGETLQERIRHSLGNGGERYTRTIKLGVGVARTEFEEETTREVFESLWPLTSGRRVQKVRHVIPAGDHVWEVDDFTDRELVLAEIELNSEQERLKSYVVREVTNEPEYVNLNLAK